jgi:serine/threonine protein phosphatase PrpC
MTHDGPDAVAPPDRSPVPVEADPRIPAAPDPPAGQASLVPPAQTAAPEPAHQLWCGSTERLRALSVWTERIPGRGEDAEPFVAHHQESGQGLLAVFDGSGGSGAASVWQSPDGTSHTGAWVGSRAARMATDCWFHAVATGGEQDGPGSLREYLRYFLSKAPQRPSKIGGTMRRQLPTTLAAIHYRQTNADSGWFYLRPMWAGDSRAYVLVPGRGLQVLTRDHTAESDALELLRTDPPMTNTVCADREFEIDSAEWQNHGQFLLVVATDGFFGYVNTPSEFEYVLLNTLDQARGEREWADLLRREVQKYTADDASLAVVALGFADFADVRGSFRARRDELEQQLSEAGTGPDAAHPPTTSQDPGTRAALHARVRAWQDETWDKYRVAYEQFMPQEPEEHA